MQKNRCTLFPLVLALTLAACESPSDTDDDDGGNPGPSVNPAGFHLVRSGDAIFTWMEGDPLEADTLRITWDAPIGVDFVWLDGAGAQVAVGDSIDLIVTTADADYVTFSGGGDESEGVFHPGGFPEVETSFRVRLLVEGHPVIDTPQLVLRITP